MGYLSCDEEGAALVEGLVCVVTLAVAVTQLVRIQLRAPRYWSSQKQFHIFISLFMLVRSAADLLFAFHIVTRPARLFYILWSVPALIFFTTYTYLVSEWAGLLRSANNVMQTPPQRKCNPLLAINAVIYLLQIGVFVLLFVPGDEERALYLSAQPYFFGLVAILSCFAFLFYGCRLYRLFARNSYQSQVHRRIIVSIFTVTIFCTLCFFTRGVTNFIWVQTVARLSPCPGAIFFVAFYTFIEVMPSYAVLWALREMPRRQNKARLPNRIPSHLQLPTSSSNSSIMEPLNREASVVF